MGLVASFLGIERATTAAAALASKPAAVAGPPSTDPASLAGILSTRAGRVAIEIATGIPAVKRALFQIAGRPATWAMRGWASGHALPPQDPRIAWLAQPDPRRSYQWTMTKTMTDLFWGDVAVWRILDRRITDNLPVAAERINPRRIDTVADPRDPDTVTTWILDGREIDPGQLIVFDGGGLGGLQRYGYELLTLYGELQAAAGRYARAPHPHAILKNHGADLDDDEITELLDAWEAARNTRSVGYLNDVVDYEAQGWNPAELQLTEAREHAALEVARLTGLPAFALDAKTGATTTYQNAVESRRDIVQALGPWMGIITSTLSMDDRTTARNAGKYLPRHVTVDMVSDDYLRDGPKTRMETWAIALDKQILTAEEVRKLEPLTRSDA